MKRFFFLYLAALSWESALSQWLSNGSSIYNANSGYVGIGTNSPTYPLHLSGYVNDILGITATGGGRGGIYMQNINSGGFTSMIMENDHGSLGSFASYTIGGSTNGWPGFFGLSPIDRVALVAGGSYNLGLSLGTMTAEPIVFGSNNVERMRVFGSGNVAIGTTSDNGNLLQVNGNLWATGLVLPTGAGAGMVLTSDASGNATWQSAGSSGSSSRWSLSGDMSTVYDATDNVAIGTTSTPAGYKMAVNGSAIFTKVVVKPQSAWADYVFKKGYVLPGLAELEQYIRDNGHLPGIATEQDVQRVGIDLGEQQTALLKKVEELTLYLINENKSLKEQNQQISQQNKQLNDQNARLEAQQKEIDELKAMILKKSNK
jgi:hypothetical protein